MVRFYCTRNFRTHDDKEFSAGFFYDDTSYCREAYLAGAMIPESTKVEQDRQREEAEKDAILKREKRAVQLQELAQARLSAQERLNAAEAEKRERRLQSLLKNQRLAAQAAVVVPITDTVAPVDKKVETFSVDLDKLLEVGSSVLITEIAEPSSDETGRNSDEDEGDK